ncbi:hypothetical protein FE257_002404 [Aspergillus nanangensis]|uniref:Uncharacterized protein n=1 Tax=Aspergillus nanangensis TaxID=2582783 RepID=A0AAD4CCP9_ASPNN|nr:hypothetical protein FE257_002404 [Aspergillus nanangensis]
MALERRLNDIESRPKDTNKPQPWFCLKSRNSHESDWFGADLVDCIEGPLDIPLKIMYNTKHSPSQVAKFHWVTPSGDQPVRRRPARLSHNTEVVAHLLDIGAPMNFEPFAKATREKQYDILQSFLDHGWDISTESAIDNKVPSALVYTFNDLDLATWFLERGADPNKRCQLRDATPLSYAIFEASFAISELFFKYGASTEHGQLLHFASMRHGLDAQNILEYLCNKDPRAIIRINQFLDEGYPEYTMNYRFGLCTPVQYAARAGSLESEILDWARRISMAFGSL